MKHLIKESHWYEKECFAKACQERIGIKPLEDDRLVLDASVAFSSYIKTFKRLDHSLDWHKHLINSLVNAKVTALSQRIKKKYGTHKEYLDRVSKRSHAGKTQSERVSIPKAQHEESSKGL